VYIAASITRAASKQTYYTIRYLADPELVEDAYRAYAYFRWVDDVLDTGNSSRDEHRSFISRQTSLLEQCYRGEPVHVENIQENMLVDLVRHDLQKNSGLQSYLRNMMLVMDFDARRRGRLISQAELNEYTRWLAGAVT
jgi:phytoene/squalene synthetase